MSDNKIYTKDPDAILDYGIKWLDFLGVDTIASSTWTVASGLTKVSDSNTATVTTIWLSGGTAGTSYSVSNKIVTAGGRTDERTLTISVEQSSGLVSTTRYATAAELKLRIGITDAVDDAVIAQVLDAVSRGIDNYCNRFFHRTAAGTVRYYTAQKAGSLLLDDFVTLTVVATDSSSDRTYATTWAATDYDMMPANAAADGIPYDHLETTPNGNYSFPVGLSKGVKLTGTWGWSAVPDPVHEACLLQASRVFKRKDAPFGISGSPELGMMRIGRLDPDVLWMLDTYRKLVAV